jgi:hypothetical protein
MTTYLLQDGDTFTAHNNQPSQDEVKAKGEGTYVLFRDDGSIKLTWVVATNRKSNLSVLVQRPADDDVMGVPTVRLVRVRKALETAVKYWSAPKSLLTKVIKEEEHRAGLLRSHEDILIALTLVGKVAVAS